MRGSPLLQNSPSTKYQTLLNLCAELSQNDGMKIFCVMHSPEEATGGGSIVNNGNINVFGGKTIVFDSFSSQEDVAKRNSEKNAEYYIRCARSSFVAIPPKRKTPPGTFASALMMMQPRKVVKPNTVHPAAQISNHKLNVGEMHPAVRVRDAAVNEINSAMHNPDSEANRITPAAPIRNPGLDVGQINPNIQTHDPGIVRMEYSDDDEEEMILMNQIRLQQQRNSILLQSRPTLDHLRIVAESDISSSSETVIFESSPSLFLDSE